MNRGLEILPLRGNVDTRLARVADGSFDAIIIAMAGLKRLGRVKDVKFVRARRARFYSRPAGRARSRSKRWPIAKDDALDRALDAINDPRTFYETAAERAFLAAIEASCTTPVGVRARIDGDTLALAAMLFSPDGAQELSESMKSRSHPTLRQPPRRIPASDSRKKCSRAAPPLCLGANERAREEA